MFCDCAPATHIQRAAEVASLWSPIGAFFVQAGVLFVIWAPAALSLAPVAPARRTRTPLSLPHSCASKVLPALSLPYASHSPHLFAGRCSSRRDVSVEALRVFSCG